MGLCHEARARVAHAADDYASFIMHSAEASRWLRPTGNPALIAVAEKLVELAAGSDSDTAVDPAVSDSTTAVTTAGSGIGGSQSVVSVLDRRRTVP